MGKKNLIVILGPTASGKSSLAVRLAQKFQGEIVNADSRQVYQEMDIGTAKVKGKKKKDFFLFQNIPHYLLNILKPDQKFTVAEYKERALRVIQEIHQRKKIPFLTGGTGLYIKSLVDNLEIPGVAPDYKLRKKIERLGLEKAYQELLKLDPKAEAIVQKENFRRVIRALEVCLIAKKPFSQLQRKGKTLFNVLQIGLNIPREKLYKIIDQRVDLMIKEGFVEEARRLIKKGYSLTLPSLSGIGYIEIIKYLQKKISLEEAAQEIKYHTHQYARRQMTWFKKDKRIKWVKGYREAERLVKLFIKKKI